MVGLHHAVLGGYGAALHQGQKVPLHALARHVGPEGLRPAADLVDLVDEHDAVLFHRFQRPGLELLLIHHRGCGLLGEQPHRLFHLELAGAGALVAHRLKHVLQLAGHFLHAGRGHDLHPHGRKLQFHFHFHVVQIAAPQSRGQFPFIGAYRQLRHRPRGGGKAHQGVEHPPLGAFSGAVANPVHFGFAHHLHRGVGQIPHNAVHLAPHVAHLGELGGLHLDEGRTRQPRQPPGNLGLADSGRPHHQNILGRDLGSQALVELHPPPAVSERDGHGPLGVLLADHVLVELLDDFPGRHLGHDSPPRVSITISELV